MCIHAAHAEGAGSDSRCIFEATAASCEHASALLQRDAGSQSCGLAPVLQCNEYGHICMLQSMMEEASCCILRH